MKALCVIAALVATPTTAAELTISLQDGNPWDILQFRNAGCPLYDATLIVDFRPSAAGVFLDTTYGPPGTRDPMPVETLSGDVKPAPVVDGTRVLIINIGSLKTNGIAQIGMDMDDSGNARVEVYGSELQGTLLTLISNDARYASVFDKDGIARIGGYDEEGCGTALTS